MTDQLVTIATFNTIVDADFAKMQLESEGIDCTLQNEYVGTINLWYLSAGVGIQLLVRSSDAEKALEALEKNHKTEEPQKTESQFVSWQYIFVSVFIFIVIFGGIIFSLVGLTWWAPPIAFLFIAALFWKLSHR